MALGTFIAGRYSATLTAVDLGITRRGWELQLEPKFEVLNESDLYGLSTFDLISRGADCHVQALLLEWKAAPLAAMWAALSGTQGVLSSSAAPLGRLASDSLAAALVMTATAATPAAATPATLTASKAIIAPNWNVNSAFDSRLREMPIRWQLLPYVSTNTIFFSTT